MLLCGNTDLLRARHLAHDGAMLAEYPFPTPCIATLKIFLLRTDNRLKDSVEGILSLGEGRQDFLLNVAEKFQQNFLRGSFGGFRYGVGQLLVQLDRKSV